jgi:hypothetical protein
MPHERRRDTSEHLRLQWGEVLVDAQHRGVHREVTRRDRVAAVLVPPAWHEEAARAHAPAAELRVWPSRTAREDLTVLLDDVEYHGAHVAVTRYRRTAAVVVPPVWYQDALEALDEGGEPE